MKLHPRARLSRIMAALAATAIALSTLVGVGLPATADELTIPVNVTAVAEGCQADDASLTWGFKESFRSYISGSIANGEWTVADGATYETPNFGWVGGAGAYDPQKSTGLVEFTGAVTFTGHGGILNTTVANPRIEFTDADSAVLLLDVSGTTQEGAPIDSQNVEFVDLELSDGTVDLVDGVLTVTDAAATLTAAGAEAFGTYPSGEPFDALTLVLTLSPDCDTAVAAPAPDTTTLVAGIALIALVALIAAIVVVVLRRRAAR